MFTETLPKKKKKKQSPQPEYEILPKYFILYF